MCAASYWSGGMDGSLMPQEIYSQSVVWQSSPTLTASKVCELYGNTYVSHTVVTHPVSCGQWYGLAYHNGTNFVWQESSVSCWKSYLDVNGICTWTNADVTVIDSITCDGTGTTVV
jgi:hypothetical protein